MIVCSPNAAMLTRRNNYLRPPRSDKTRRIQYARHLYQADLWFSAGLEICRVAPAKDPPSGESEGAIQVRIGMNHGCIA